MDDGPRHRLSPARRAAVLSRFWRPVAGATAGGVAALVSALLAAAVAENQLFIGNLPLVSVIVSGLLLGWAAAAAAFVVALGILVAFGVIEGIPLLTAADLLPLVAFALAAPVIVLLLRRGETHRMTAIEAKTAAEVAHQEAERERGRLQEARLEVDAALADAERERARLEEVAEAIPEPLIVYDESGQGTYGNRAAMRLFGRSFIERRVDEWGRATEPRDEHGVALERDEWPQLLAQVEPDGAGWREAGRWFVVPDGWGGAAGG